MRILLISLLVLLSLGSKAQDTGKIDLSRFQQVVLDDDTTWVFVLKDFSLVEWDWAYRSMVKKVKFTYPYAHTAVDVLKGLGFEDDAEVNRKVRKKARQKNKEVKRDFRDAILDMTETEGAVLCKLIYKETGMTAYDIIRKYRGTAKAIYWQSISRLGGADLKQTYDPEKDVLLHRVLNDVETGKVRIPDEPEVRKRR